MEINNKDDNYIYPVLVKEDDGTFLIEVIDFPNVVTYAETEDQIVTMAQDLIALTIVDYLQRGMELPKPTSNLKNALYINVWLPYYKSKIRTIYIKKTLTIPSWLDILARENNINFSAALVRGVKEELGIKD